MSRRHFTWVNNRQMLTYEKLDRVLMDAECKRKFPMVTLCALEHIEILLDHASIILDSNSLVSCTARHPFKFKLGWLQREGFADIIKNVWKGLPLVERRYRDGILLSMWQGDSLLDGRNTSPTYTKYKNKAWPLLLMTSSKGSDYHTAWTWDWYENSIQWADSTPLARWENQVVPKIQSPVYLGGRN